MRVYLSIVILFMISISASFCIDVNPCFSSDDSKLVFERVGDDAKRSELMLISIDSPDKLIPLTANCTGLSLKPDKSIQISTVSGNVNIDSEGKCLLSAMMTSTESTSTSVISEIWQEDTGVTFEDGILYSLSKDGNDVVRGALRTNNGSFATFSPDGQQLAFTFVNEITPGKLQRNIYIINTDGTGLQPITRQGGNTPVWSYDGLSILYRSAEGKLCRINVSGSNRKSVSLRLPKKALSLRCLPDSRSFAFISNDGSKLAWYALTPPAKHPVRISKFHAIPQSAISPTLTQDGETLAYLKRIGQSVVLYIERNKKSELRATFDISADTSNATIQAVFSNNGKQIAVSCGGNIWLVNEKGTKTRVGGVTALETDPTKNIELTNS